MSYREYQLRMEWIEQQWNNPTASDHYLMSIAQEIRRVLSKKPNEIKLKDFRIKFGEKANKPRQTAEQSRQIWMAALGLTDD